MSTLQQSHDDLALALTEFTDQLLRGGHAPTVVQWIRVANTLDAAVVHMQPTNRQWAAQVAALIATRAAEQATP